jgi:hypothetical protein
MRPVAAAAVAIVLALPAAAAEKWWDAYDRGVKAVNAKQYQAGADALQRAIAEQPAESNAIRARNQIITYVPHFFLGIAHFNLGDVDGAMREWKTSEDQGAIQNTDYYTALKEWVARGKTERQRSAQNAAAESKKSADAALSRALSGQMEAVSAGGDQGDAYRSAQRKMQEALDQFNKAGTDVRAYNHVADLAQQARDLFAAATEDAKHRKASRPATPPPVKAAAPAPQPQPAVVETVAVETKPPQPPPPATTTVATQTAPPPATATATTDSAAEPGPATLPKRINVVVPTAPPVESEARVAARVAVQKFRQRIMMIYADPQYASARNDLAKEAKLAEAMEDRVGTLTDDAALKDITNQIAARERDVAALLDRAAARSASQEEEQSTRAQLESAYRAFASGNFTVSEDLLTKILTRTQSSEAYLLRGCTRYTRAMLSAKPADLLVGARLDFREALKINASLRLNDRSFSPKLVAFFENVRRNGGS